MKGPCAASSYHDRVEAGQCAWMSSAIAGSTGNLPLVQNADIHYAQSGIFTPADIPFSRDAVAAGGAPVSELRVDCGACVNDLLM